MKMEKLTKFDVAEYLDTDELQTLYLDEVVYKALSPNGNPSFATVCKILNAIGYTLVPTRIAKKTEI